MKKQIITIDSDKCVGCGLCAKTCHEDAIGMVNGKAVLLKEDHCDGLGRCLPKCPTGAISFIEKEINVTKSSDKKVEVTVEEAEDTTNVNVKSQLRSWPIEIQLVAPNAQFFDGCDLLISADCCAYAYGNFHNEFMKNKVVVIGCPKLDDVDYSEKLTTILKSNNIKSVTVARMEVPCCSGIANATIKAVENCGKDIPLSISTISRDGKIIG